MDVSITNLATVNRRIGVWKKGIPRNALAMHKAFVLLIFGLNIDQQQIVTTGLFSLFPVDTGVARSNVNTGAGSIAGLSAAVDLVSTFHGTTGDPPTASERRRIVDGMAAAKPYGTILIAFEAPYTRRLNEGHSPKAQPGWIELSGTNAGAAFKRLPSLLSGIAGAT